MRARHLLLLIGSCVPFVLWAGCNCSSAIPCVSSTNCPTNQKCSVTGFCATPCSTNGNCTSGQICNQGTCATACIKDSDCGGGQVCSGGVCAAANSDAGCVGPVCVTNCTDGGDATLTGVVYAPTDPSAGFGNPDPIPNALVYIPSGPIQPFTDGVTCQTCAAAASGNPVVYTVTAANGAFTLAHVPTGSNVPLVVEVGRWRREVTIPEVPSCQIALKADQTRLPRTQSEGNIPRIAMVTGNVDAFECVLRKMGIADSEFTAPTGSGRVAMYQDNGAAAPDGTKTPEVQLTGSLDTLEQYDLVVFACHGGQVNQNATDQQNVIDYTSDGGRVFATHFSYVWLFNDPPFDGSANFLGTLPKGEGRNDGTVSVDIDTSFAKGLLLSQWLQLVGASTTPGSIPLGVLREDFTTVVSPSQNWLTWNNPPGGNPWQIHYTFNTPMGQDAGSQCGRVVFSDFHVENENDGGSFSFPNECHGNVPMTPQEKVLEFMLFDVSACIQSDQCRQQGQSCSTTNACCFGLGCLDPAGAACPDGATNCTCGIQIQ